MEQCLWVFTNGPPPNPQVLSRAFRNRFVELHFNELPIGELETILHQRCSLPPSYCSKLVKVMQDLQVTTFLSTPVCSVHLDHLFILLTMISPFQSFRRGSSVFAGKHGFITLRDLFRWADRYRLEEQTENAQDWLQLLADDGQAFFSFSLWLNLLFVPFELYLKLFSPHQDTCCWPGVSGNQRKKPPSCPSCRSTSRGRWTLKTCFLRNRWPASSVSRIQLSFTASPCHSISQCKQLLVII